MSRLVICADGVVTPLGINAVQSAASIRAGLSAFDETTIVDRCDNPIVMAKLPEDDLPDLSDLLSKDKFLTFRESRMIALARLAFDQVRDSLPQPSSVRFFIGTGDFQANPPIDPHRFGSRLLRTFGESSSGAGITVLPFGRAAGLMALDSAINSILAGECTFAVAGGVDTYYDLMRLGTLDFEERLLTDRRLEGFLPGEGAALLVVTTEQAAESAQLQPSGYVDASAIGEEPGHMYSNEPYRGDGLAETVSRLLANGNHDVKVPTVFSSMNGENHFAKEWGVTYLRNTHAISEDFRIEHPADCIGDTGAASGPIMIALALQGLSGRYLEGPVLVYASSDNAPRAACLISNNGIGG